MKKFLYFFAAPLLAGICIFFAKIGVGTPSNETAQAWGNEVTCYSSIINQGSTWTVYDCGPCTSIDTDGMVDPGKCEYNSGGY